MLSQNSSFYVTLPSNGSKKFFPENKTNSYKNQLAREIRVDGDWEVALTEVHYPQTTKSMDQVFKIQFLIYRFDDQGSIQASQSSHTNGDPIQQLKCPIQYELGSLVFKVPESTKYGKATGLDSIVIEFPIAKYSSPNAVVEYVTREIANKVEELNPQDKLKLGKLVEFGFDSPTNKFYLKPLYPLLDFLYYKADVAARILGLKPLTNTKYEKVELRKTLIFPFSPELNIVNSLYIYTDVIENDIVGDTLVPLLRTVNFSGEAGTVIHEIFTRCYYKRVNRTNIPSIEIQINSETGKEVKFESGHVICVLHFRKVTG